MAVNFRDVGVGVENEKHRVGGVVESWNGYNCVTSRRDCGQKGDSRWLQVSWDVGNPQLRYDCKRRWFATGTNAQQRTKQQKERTRGLQSNEAWAAAFIAAGLEGFGLTSPLGFFKNAGT